MIHLIYISIIDFFFLFDFYNRYAADFHELRSPIPSSLSSLSLNCTREQNSGGFCDVIPSQTGM